IPGARRRRKKRNREDPDEQPSTSIFTADILERKLVPRKSFKSTLLAKDYPVYNAMYPHKNLSNAYPSGLRVNVSDSYYSESHTTMTETARHRASSTVSIKRVKRADINQLDNKEKLNETENVNNASVTDAGNNTNNGRLRRSTVSVVRISKANEASLRKSIT
ncbi:unnamed protein product, partial [Rotaria socialis]